MKIAVLLLACLLARPMWALSHTGGLLANACGPDSTSFSLRAEPSRPSLIGPPASGARVVVFAEDVNGLQGCWLVNRIGLDGQWIGAVCMQTYISAEISSGPRHLCADIQQKRGPQHTALYDFTATPGKVYYFRVENIGAYFNVHLEPLNDAEGRLLLSIRKRSVGTAMKGK